MKREVSRSLLSRYVLQVGDGGRRKTHQQGIMRARPLAVIGNHTVRDLCDGDSEVCGFIRVRCVTVRRMREF